ncbi:hypothetical protein QAD02_008141 [Eretmocerus hayati]|uniref:Uncharacterized protein n=1 Tax=Eretmocerus hayati TaxID=131215 RepID=A0ACC2N612_9HYME|nr:hypothetical protein QAD02_008141 [Eretmocerus hayati]
MNKFNPAFALLARRYEEDECNETERELLEVIDLPAAAQVVAPARPGWVAEALQNEPFDITAQGAPRAPMAAREARSEPCPAPSGAEVPEQANQDTPVPNNVEDSGETTPATSATDHPDVEYLPDDFTNEVIYIFKQINMSAAQICSFVIGDVCGDIYNPLHEWEIVFPPVDKPPIKPPVLPLEGAPNFKVLHISDTHFDPYYQEGSNAECNEPLCCRITNGPPSTPAAAAGKWGDYRKCDTPKRTVDHMLKHISNSHQVSHEVRSDPNVRQRCLRTSLCIPLKWNVRSQVNYV